MRRTIVRSYRRRTPRGGLTEVKKHGRKVAGCSEKLARVAIKYAERKLIRLGKALTKQAILVIAVSFLVSSYGVDPVTAKKAVWVILV